MLYPDTMRIDTFGLRDPSHVVLNVNVQPQIAAGLARGIRVRSTTRSRRFLKLRHYQDYVIIRLGLPRDIHAAKNDCVD